MSRLFSSSSRYMVTSYSNLLSSRSIFQNFGFIKLLLCAKKLLKPFLLPHSQNWPSSTLTENDTSEAPTSMPWLSISSIVCGHVTRLKTMKPISRSRPSTLTVFAWPPK
uniref:Uncharacterized protein n=1 Tax=Opuntia streptacantha TaxID=393608 RepID=A0A7C8Z547_OPUST